MSYHLIKNILFRLDPELAHSVTLNSLKTFNVLGLNKIFNDKTFPQPKPIQIMGLNFNNKVGLAAGLDKNGDYIDALANLGFGFIEVGTVTPLPQQGNPKPRLFRIPEAEAIINRMGFNNKGIDHLVNQVKRAKYKGILGINIGKNAVTSLEEAKNDYLICLRKAYSYASYITVNISSPNTMGLRDLQHGEFLHDLLRFLKQEQKVLELKHQKMVPLVVKVAPDLTESEVVALADTFLGFEIEGVIATNTTISREGVQQYQISREAGGLSGSPLTHKSTEVLKLFRRELQGKIPLIASGGIMSAEIAADKFAAGADLVQLYTGLIYQGPKLINACAKIK